MSTPAREAAEAYLRAVNARDGVGLASLFAPDAVALNTFGIHEGRHSIMAFYRDLVFANAVTVEPTEIYEAGATCVVELDGRIPSGLEVQHMVDIFTVGTNGQVTRLAIYRR